MPDFYLRFLRDEDRPWLRRGLFLAYDRTRLIECAAKFPARDQALAFAREMKLLAELELVTMSAEAIDAG